MPDKSSWPSPRKPPLFARSASISAAGSRFCRAMSKAWAAVAAASFSPVPTARRPGSSGPSGPAPCPRPGKRRPVPGQPGPPQAARPVPARCPGRLDGELRGLFVRGLGDGADVVAHPGGKRGGQRCARDVTPRDEARRLPVRAGVRSRRHRDHQDPSRAHLGRAPSASVSPDLCGAAAHGCPRWWTRTLAAAVSVSAVGLRLSTSTRWSLRNRSMSASEFTVQIMDPIPCR